MPDTPPRVLIVSGSVGAGHDGAAAELARRLRDVGVRVEIRDYLHALPRPARLVLRRGYTASIRYRPGVLEWLFDRAERGPAMRRVIDGMCWVAQRRVRLWARDAALVVSTFPFASQTLGQLRLSGALDVPVVTYLTDPAPHRLWVHHAVDHHLTVTDATATAGSRQYGVAMRAVGGLVGAAFTRSHTREDRAAVRRALGIPAGRSVALVVAGSEGMGSVPATVAALGAVPSLHVVVLCGRNERLRRDLATQPGVTALGWRRDVPDLMAAADVLIHNAGGLTLTEAMSAGLPAITYQPIPGHGRVNAEVLERSGLAPWPHDDAALAAEVARQCAAGRHRPASVLPHTDACGAVLSLLAQAEAPAAAVG